MNIEMAKAIPVVKILEKFELNPIKEMDSHAVYHSPFNKLGNANFHVDKEENTWIDHDLNITGNAYDLVGRILTHQGFINTDDDIFRWLRVTLLDPSLPKLRDLVKNKKSKWKLISHEQLKKIALKRYLLRRGISVKLAKRFVKQVYVGQKCSFDKLWAIGLKNEDGGFEFQNSFIKSRVAPRTVTVIRAHIEDPPGVMIFKDFIDFLSYLTAKQGHLQHNIIVLHSIACVDHAIRYIRNHGYKVVFTWMPNTPSGKRAQERLAAFFAVEPGLVHKPKNDLYKGYTDLNSWHMYLLNRKPEISQ